MPILENTAEAIIDPRKFALDGPKGSAKVVTGWIYDRGSDAPRLTTAFVP